MITGIQSDMNEKMSLLGNDVESENMLFTFFSNHLHKYCSRAVNHSVCGQDW
jgi:hypothetical protein